MSAKSNTKSTLLGLLFLFSVILVIGSGCIGGMRSSELFKNKESEMLFTKAQKLQSAGKLDSAIIYFNKADSVAPDTPTILEERGIVKSELQQYDEALVDLSRAVDLVKDPDLRDAYLCNRGLIYQDMNRMDDACRDFTAAGKTGERNREAFCK